MSAITTVLSPWALDAPELSSWVASAEASEAAMLALSLRAAPAVAEAFEPVSLLSALRAIGPWVTDAVGLAGKTLWAIKGYSGTRGAPAGAPPLAVEGTAIAAVPG